MKKVAAGLALAFLFSAAAAFAYVIKLKDGSMLFARMKYDVKGTKAIITLENGTVTQIDLAKVDVPATDEYNSKYSGNVIAIDTPEQKMLNAPGGPPTPAPRLQDLARGSRLRGAAAPPSAGTADSGGKEGLWKLVDPLQIATFSHVFDGAAIPNWRLTNYKGKTRLLATANNEEAVFNTISAAARSLKDLSDRGKELTIEIVLTTSTNESAGSFEMTPAQAEKIVNGTLAVGDYFVRNVVL